MAAKTPRNNVRPRLLSVAALRDGFLTGLDSAAVALRTSRRIIVAGGIAVAAGLITVALVYQSTQSTQQTPRYQTLAPKGTTVDNLGGWKRVSPPKNDPVFAYADTLEGVSISVSQQPMPAAFKNDVAGNVSDLAKKFNATTKLAAGATTAYIGTSAKGPQSVIFTKNDLLIMIKSQTKISDSAWIRYVQLLDPAG